MTPQEQQMLQDLTGRVNQTVLQDKDSDAEQFLQQSLGRNPDSLYILAQTVLVQQYALDQAKKQLDQRKQQAQQPAPSAKHTSFLGNLLGMNDEPAHPPPPPPPPQQQFAPVPNYAPQPGYPAPQYAPQYAPQSGSMFGAPQQGGFLRSAMQTATGVAAGALAFEGVESLMHGFGQHAGYGSGFGDMGGGNFGGGRPEEVINNNYYGDSSPSGHNSGDFADRLSSSDSSSGHSPDVEDRRDSSNFTDPNFNDSGSGDSLLGNDFADTGSDSSANSSSDDASYVADSSDSSSFDSGSSDDSSF